MCLELLTNHLMSSTKIQAHFNFLATRMWPGVFGLSFFDLQYCLNMTLRVIRKIILLRRRDTMEVGSVPAIPRPEKLRSSVLTSINISACVCKTRRTLKAAKDPIHEYTVRGRFELSFLSLWMSRLINFKEIIEGWLPKEQKKMGLNEKTCAAQRQPKTAGVTQ